MILVDTCVLLDIFTADPQWLGWSKDALQSHSLLGLAICDVVFAELSAVFPTVEAEIQTLEKMRISILRPSPKALFGAGQAFLGYKKNRGTAKLILPDFFIGAHAQAERLSLVTRDCERYRTYFPDVQLICP